jgi:predicted TPR repeat methyltransferase
MHFDKIALNYEGMYLKMGYPDPKYVANFVAKFAKKSGQNPQDAKIIDFACGTGLVG